MQTTWDYYIEISIGLLETLLSRWEEGTLDEREQYLCFDPKARVWLAVDNRSWDFFIEEFPTKEMAELWLVVGF